MSYFVNYRLCRLCTYIFIKDFSILYSVHGIIRKSVPIDVN